MLQQQRCWPPQLSLAVLRPCGALSTVQLHTTSHLSRCRCLQGLCDGWQHKDAPDTIACCPGMQLRELTIRIGTAADLPTFTPPPLASTLLNPANMNTTQPDGTLRHKEELENSQHCCNRAHTDCSWAPPENLGECFSTPHTTMRPCCTPNLDQLLLIADCWMPPQVRCYCCAHPVAQLCHTFQLGITFNWGSPLDSRLRGACQSGALLLCTPCVTTHSAAPLNWGSH
jgi:hypothetical protein